MEFRIMEEKYKVVAKLLPSGKVVYTIHKKVYSIFKYGEEPIFSFWVPTFYYHPSRATAQGKCKLLNEVL
jgi:hypothetical protein